MNVGPREKKVCWLPPKNGSTMEDGEDDLEWAPRECQENGEECEWCPAAGGGGPFSPKVPEKLRFTHIRRAD